MPGFPTQVGGIVGSGSLHALEVDTEGAVEEYKEVRIKNTHSDEVILFSDGSGSSAAPKVLCFRPRART